MKLPRIRFECLQTYFTKHEDLTYLVSLLPFLKWLVVVLFVRRTVSDDKPFRMTITGILHAGAVLALLALFGAVKDSSATYARGYQGQTRGVWQLPRAYTFFGMHAHQCAFSNCLLCGPTCMGVLQQRGLWVVRTTVFPRKTRLNVTCCRSARRYTVYHFMKCLHATLRPSYMG